MSELGIGHILGEGHDVKRCPDCRRRGQLRAMNVGQPPTIYQMQAYERLLHYFQETQPAVASAMKFGLTPHGTDSGVYHIDYPE